MVFKIMFREYDKSGQNIGFFYKELEKKHIDTNEIPGFLQ